MIARGPAAWRPDRERAVSTALRAYALMATSAARGAVRDIGQLQRKRSERHDRARRYVRS